MSDCLAPSTTTTTGLITSHQDGICATVLQTSNSCLRAKVRLTVWSPARWGQTPAGGRSSTAGLLCAAAHRPYTWITASEIGNRSERVSKSLPPPPSTPQISKGTTGFSSACACTLLINQRRVVDEPAAAARWAFDLPFCFCGPAPLRAGF